MTTRPRNSYKDNCINNKRPFISHFNGFVENNNAAKRFEHEAVIADFDDLHMGRASCLCDTKILDSAHQRPLFA